MQVGVDDQIIVFGVGLSFAARFEKAILYFRFLLGAATAKPLLKIRKAGREDKNRDGGVGIDSANLAAALDIDIEQDVTRGCERGAQRRRRGALGIRKQRRLATTWTGRH